MVTILTLLSGLESDSLHRIAAQEPSVTEIAGEWIENGSIKIADLSRWYRIYKPKGFKANAPLVVLLHGGTQSMRKLFSSRAGGTRAWPELADKEGFLLVVPNGVNSTSGDTKGDNQNWNDLRPVGSERQTTADDVSFILQLIDRVNAEFKTDSKRVYVTGASNGGMMTYRLLIEAPEKFAAATTFIATLPADMAGVKPPKVATPILIANGTKDPLVKWTGGKIRGQGDAMMSAEENRDWWIRANRAETNSEKEEALANLSEEDGCRLYRYRYPAGDNGAPVVFLKVDGGGHALPSRNHELPDNLVVRRLIGPLCKDAEGAELAWAFMKTFKR